MQSYDIYQSGHANPMKTMPVVIIDPVTGNPTTSQLVVSTYFASTPFTGASLNDIITLTQIVNTATPGIVSAIWTNQTTGLALESVPSGANLTRI